MQHVDECAVVRGFTGTVDGRVHRGHEYFDYSYGACYNLYLQRLPNNTLVVDVEEVTVPNTVHMFWLLPQYIVLTAGEVLFSITSLAFAFTQVIFQSFLFIISFIFIYSEFYRLLRT